MTHLPRLLLLGALATAAVVLPGSVRAEQPVLRGTVGTATSPDAFRITLADAAGNRLTHLPDAGTYTVIVTDYATLHNFHLSGPGLSSNLATEVEGTGTTTWEVTFRGNGATYRYQCDPHPTQMRGSFTVGTAPALPKLAGRVGPGRAISLKTASGARVKTLAAGAYKLTVRDATRAHNFHLLGPGVNRKTGVRSRGSVTWTVRFKAGTYRYRSDASKRLAAKFVVR